MVTHRTRYKKIDNCGSCGNAEFYGGDCGGWCYDKSKLLENPDDLPEWCELPTLDQIQEGMKRS